MLKNRTSNFWSEVRKFKPSNNKCSNAIDDCVGAQEISDLFAEKYESLYNSVSFKKEDMEDIC